MGFVTTAEHEERFHDDGFFVADEVFDARECARICERLAVATFEIDLGDTDAGPLEYRPLLHHFDQELCALATDARFGPMVMPLVGGDVRLFWEQSVSKPPGHRTELPWHQDAGYQPLDPPEYVSCWLALDDADEANGCLWVLPGSHRRGLREHRRAAEVFRQGYEGDDPGVAVPVPRGGVLVFSGLLLHRSGPNTSGRERRAWILQFSPAHARSAKTGEALDDRLLVARGGQWLDTPVRERDLDLVRLYAGYSSD